MAESPKKKRVASTSRASKSKTSRSTSTRAAASKPTKSTESQSTTTSNITHRTSSIPSDEKWINKLPNIDSVRGIVSSRNFWMWVGATVAAVLIVLFAWWQWQRSYVAVVNGQYIHTNSLYDQLLANSGSQTLDTLIQQQLIIQEGSKHGIHIEDEQIQNELDDFIETSGGEESYRKSLREFGISESLLQDQVRVRLTLEELLKDKISVSDEEIEEYYNANKAEVDVANEGLEAASERIEMQLSEQKLSQESAKYLESIQAPATMSRKLSNASVTFSGFIQEEVLSIPADVWNLISKGF